VLTKNLLAKACEIVCTSRLSVLVDVEPLSGRSHAVHVWVGDGRLRAGRDLVVVLVAEDHVCGIVFECDHCV